MVNSPAHYTRGTQEAIDIIEEAIQDAPNVKSRNASSTSTEVSTSSMAER